MLQTQTMDKLRALKLNGMVKALEEQLSSSEYEGLDFEERLGFMIDRETMDRENRRLNTRLKQAKLREQACFEDIDYSHSRGLKKSVILSLGSCKWISDRQNVIITGATGVGKSYLACALAHKACLEGFKARYHRASRMFRELRAAHGDGSYAKLVNALAKFHLLVIDDWGLEPLKTQERNDLFEILEDRHGVHSTIIAGQLPIENWPDIIGNPTIADAIMDRLIHNAHKINLTGDSMRKKKSIG